MFLKSQTKQEQSKLANYCRTGKYQRIPGAEKARLKHYRRLVYNIIYDSLQSAYPLAYQLLQNAEWDELVESFTAEHTCQSPQVWLTPHEFYEYVINHLQPIIKKYPFLPNLLEMEWLEVELFMMEDIEVSFRKDQETANDKLVISPEHRLVKLDYPVHLKNASQIELSDKSDFFLVMHREQSSGKVIFTDVSIFFARLIEILSVRPLPVSELISIACGDFNLQVNNKIEEKVGTFFQKSIDSQLILGFTN